MGNKRAKDESLGEGVQVFGAPQEKLSGMEAGRVRVWKRKRSDTEIRMVQML